MVWVKISTSLRLGDLCHHGYSNNHIVKDSEGQWSWLKETIVESAVLKRLMLDSLSLSNFVYRFDFLRPLYISYLSVIGSFIIF